MATEFNPAEAVDANVLEAQYEAQQTMQRQNNHPNQPEDFKVVRGGEETKVEEAPVETQPELVEEVTTTAPEVEVAPETQEEIIEVDGSESSFKSEPEVTPTSDLPEIVQKFYDFHNDTGGGMEEYQQYTKDYESLNDAEVLKEYYKLTKPTYTTEDIDLLMEDKYGVSEVKEGEEISREDRLKMLSMKDDLSNAKSHLKSNRDKYYTDLKSGVLGAPDQYKEAVDFYNKAQTQQKQSTEFRSDFVKKSEQVFNNDFKGFPFEANGKKYRLKVGNAGDVMKSQLDINELLSGFVGDDGMMSDVEDYHKSVWAASNADKIFYSAYEQGKADALKERAANTKNPDYNPQTEQSKPSVVQKYKFLDS